MKKLKTFLLILLCALFVGALAACGGGKKYTVTFETYGGTQIESYVLKKGAKIERPADPEKALFTFAGWYADDEFEQEFDFTQKMPEKDVTVYARWTSETSSRVSYDSMGGSPVEPSVGIVGSPLTAPADPTYEGYKFGGWYADADCSVPFTFTTFPAESTTVYANWIDDPNYAYIDYVGNGSRLARVPVRKGETYSAPDFLGNGKDGLAAFSGQSVILSDWYSDANLTQKHTFGTANGNVTLYASYYSAGLEITNGSVVRYNGTDSTVFIPERIAGDTTPVTSVGDRAFSGNNDVNNISLPASIESVGEQAFYRCEYLVTVNLPDTLESIGAYAFFACSRLTSYGDITGVDEIPEGLFLGCKKLSAVTLSQTATSVGAQAFADCENLTEITLPAQVTAVPAGLFDGCTRLKKVVLPDAMTQFGMDADNEYAGRVFNGCIGLAEIVLASSNPNFGTIDGSLYRIEGGDPVELLYYVRGNEKDTAFALPDGASIAAGAFNGNSTLESIVVPSATEIACGAFEGIRSLKSLTLPTFEGGYLGYYFGAREKQTDGKYSTSIPATLTSVTFTSSVTEVADHAFYGAVGLEQVSGLGDVTSIGKEAFAYTHLTSFEVPSGLADLGASAFEGCAALEAFSMSEPSEKYAVYDSCLYQNVQGQAYGKLIVVPAAKTEIAFADEVTQIGVDAFADSAIEEVVVPDSVTFIDFAAFRGVKALTRLTVPFIGSRSDQLTYMGYVFGSTFEYEETQDSENTAYTSLKVTNPADLPATLKSITVNKTYPEIPDGAFAYCTGLEEVNFPAGSAVTSIGKYAFYYTSLAAWDFTGVETIKDFAFRLSSLNEVALPDVRDIGYGAFSMIEPLKAISFGEGLTTIGAQAFCAAAEQIDSTHIAFSSNFSGELVIPSTVTEIGSDAFFGLGMLYDNTQNIPATDFSVRFATDEETGKSALTTIGNGSFAYSALRTVAIPASITYIGAQSFQYCDYLVSVTIGSAEENSAIADIGALAFSFCGALRDFTMHVSAVVTMTLWQSSRDIFYSSSDNFAIYVPQTLVEAYRAADNWKTYSNRIAAIAE